MSADTPPGNALEYLEMLRACSLVVAEEVDGEMRYRVLETVRDYGATHLTEAERIDLARDQAEYYLALSEQAERKRCIARSSVVGWIGWRRSMTT